MKKSELHKALKDGNGLVPVKKVLARYHKGEVPLKLILDESINPDSPVGKEAAWCIEFLHRENKSVLKPHFPKLIKAIPALKDFRQTAVLLKLVSRSKISVEELSPLIDYSLEALHREEEADYLPYYCMQILESVVKGEPEFAREFRMAIEHALPKYEKFYLRNMASRIIKRCRNLEIELGN